MFNFSTSFFISVSAKEFFIAPPQIIIGFFALDISLAIKSIFFGSGLIGSDGNLQYFLFTHISWSEISAFCISKGKLRWQAPGLPEVLFLKAFLILSPNFYWT